jgi:hypothetical protein
MNADPHSEPTDRDLAAGEVVELTVLARQAGVKIVHVRRYVEFGLIEPHPAAMPTPSALIRPTPRGWRGRSGCAVTSGSTTPAPCSSANCWIGSASSRPAPTSRPDAIATTISSSASGRGESLVEARSQPAPAALPSKNRATSSGSAGSTRLSFSISSRSGYRPARNSPTAASRSYSVRRDSTPGPNRAQ